ncbi:MAG TPA: MinD/ParA family protein [Fibrobacteria bacterium]|nr:MinD/ParA family protein [Fibrobacteria bacterium]HOX51385.1 MinD/ParA family protein [Fibrobacteria bacterium]
MPSQLDSLRSWNPSLPARLGHSTLCPTLAVSSGKGGVGKSHIALSMALALADLDRRILLVDGDMGLANLHILCGLHPKADLDDVLAGRATPSQALLSVGPGVDLLPSASGVAQLSSLPPERLNTLTRALGELQSGYDLAIVDTGAGIGETTMNLVMASDRLLLVTTPEPTAQADAYALLKVLRSQRKDLSVGVCVNMAASEEEAASCQSRLIQVCGRFLSWEPSLAGWIPRQAGLERHVLERRPAFRAAPDSAFARAIRTLAREAAGDLPSGSGFFERLSETSSRDRP